MLSLLALIFIVSLIILGLGVGTGFYLAHRLDRQEVRQLRRTLDENEDEFWRQIKKGIE